MTSRTSSTLWNPSRQTRTAGLRVHGESDAPRSTASAPRGQRSRVPQSACTIALASRSVLVGSPTMVVRAAPATLLRTIHPDLPRGNHAVGSVVLRPCASPSTSCWTGAVSRSFWAVASTTGRLADPEGGHDFQRTGDHQVETGRRAGRDPGRPASVLGDRTEGRGHDACRVPGDRDVRRA
jgi:hypothetical protein